MVLPRLEPVCWAVDTPAASIQHMGVDHGRAYVPMPE